MQCRVFNAENTQELERDINRWLNGVEFRGRKTDHSSMTRTNQWVTLSLFHEEEKDD